MAQDKYPIERFCKRSTEEVEAWEDGYDCSAKEEKARLKRNIGLLRQWLNEKTNTNLITNNELEEFLIS